MLIEEMDENFVTLLRQSNAHRAVRWITVRDFVETMHRIGRIVVRSPWVFRLILISAFDS